MIDPKQLEYQNKAVAICEKVMKLTRKEIRDAFVNKNGNIPVNEIVGTTTDLIMHFIRALFQVEQHGLPMAPYLEQCLNAEFNEIGLEFTIRKKDKNELN